MVPYSATKKNPHLVGSVVKISKIQFRDEK
jgi:hypothetical protein